MIVKVTRHTPEEDLADKVDIIYQAGQPALRVYYRDGRRYAEEVLRDGQVIRRREFEPPQTADQTSGDDQ